MAAGCSFATDTKKGEYSYQATDANSQNCTSDVDCTNFVLTATLDSGVRYQKQSLQ
jgi:hypothetical protein